MKDQLHGRTTVVLSSENPAAELHFDLSRLKMNDRHRAIVQKLFAQNPVAEVNVDEHTHAAERGKDGPASKYLSKEEFETVRQIGVRLGTSGVLAATVCDFCLHCVKLEAMPDFGKAIQ